MAAAAPDIALLVDAADASINESSSSCITMLIAAVLSPAQRTRHEFQQPYAVRTRWLAHSTPLMPSNMHMNTWSSVTMTRCPVCNLPLRPYPENAAVDGRNDAPENPVAASYTEPTISPGLSGVCSTFFAAAAFVSTFDPQQPMGVVAPRRVRRRRQPSTPLPPPGHSATATGTGPGQFFAGEARKPLPTALAAVPRHRRRAVRGNQL
mmetsp:Transcript_42553/g.127615  ORF Transcript_42553/g.127615 Transcript_42553/m.127615 type:complete len:208 (-) Transcript_42553:86-709(-)